MSEKPGDSTPPAETAAAAEAAAPAETAAAAPAPAESPESPAPAEPAAVPAAESPAAGADAAEERPRERGARVAPGNIGGGGRAGGARFGRSGERRERGPMSVKARLRAKARKKARKVAKKRGGGFLRKKVCRFCADSKLAIEYKEPKGLRYFITETGKMIPQRISGNCAKHQRAVAVAVKRARQLALMPYTSHHGGG